MKCPKCGEVCYVTRCNACETVWTDWQQSRIAKLEKALESIRDIAKNWNTAVEDLKRIAAIADAALKEVEK